MEKQVQANFTADGVSSPTPWYGGPGSVTAYGTFGGGTVTLQMSPDNGTTWLNVDRPSDNYVTFTANGGGDFQLGLCLLRFSLTGATEPSVIASL